MKEAQSSGGEQDRVFAEAMDAAFLYGQLERGGATSAHIVEEGVPGSAVGREWRERHGSNERVWRLMFELLPPYSERAAAQDPRVPAPRIPMPYQHPSTLESWADELEEQTEEATRFIARDDEFAAKMRVEASDNHYSRLHVAERIAADVALRTHRRRRPNATALAAYAAAIRVFREKLLEASERST